MGFARLRVVSGRGVKQQHVMVGFCCFLPPPPPPPTPNSFHFLFSSSFSVLVERINSNKIILFSLSIFVCLSACLSVCDCVCVCVYLSVCLYCMSVCLLLIAFIKKHTWEKFEPREALCTRSCCVCVSLYEASDGLVVAGVWPSECSAVCFVVSIIQKVYRFNDSAKKISSNKCDFNSVKLNS